nr:HD domain-containing protein [Bacteroidota bacterium]
MNFELAYLYVMEYLPANLPDYIHYHNVEHTVEVVRNIETIARGENVNDEEMVILKTAALFHDTGFTQTYNNHEFVSTQIAREVLPKYGYSDEQIDLVSSLIMATVYPPQPKNKLEMIISDADILYIGEDDFDNVAKKLEIEFKHEAIINDHNDWLRTEYNFLKNAKFYTDTAKKLMDEGLRKNLEEAERQYLESINSK